MSCGPELEAELKKKIITKQTDEFTEYHIYSMLAERQRSEHNKTVLQKIALEEKRHCGIWQEVTCTQVKPRRLKIFFYSLLERIFGFTFAIKIMERGEDSAGSEYEKWADRLPQAMQIAREEKNHENQLIEILDEERLQYVGSMVLGLNDALVELTGTLAGLSLALQSNRLVALSGLITGISATLSMASSEYLSARSQGKKDALKSCLYTGVMYLVTVALLVLPYLLFPDKSYVSALISMLATVICIIFIFTYYISVARSMPFGERFFEMAAISMGVACLSFLIGLAVKHFLRIDI